MSDQVVLRRDGELAWIELNRPEKRNALSLEMWERLAVLADEAEADPDVKVVIVCGSNGEAFSAGADIGEFETLRSTEEGARRYDEVVRLTEARLALMPKPTIAMVQGACIGGGCSIAIACDMRLADTRAKFGITPARLGLVYSLPATRLLVDLVGPSKAKMILFSGRHIPAARAHQMGLVDELHDPDDLRDKTVSLAKTIASRAQTSVRGSKRIIRLILDGHTRETEESRRLHLDAFDTEDYREGVRAFLEKRQPRFQ